MRILLTGKNGQLGRCFQDVISEDSQGYELFAFGSADLDITNKQQLMKVVDSIKPDIIINAAAYTHVDQAEVDKEQAFLVNETGTRLLANAANKLNIPLIHISTDYVFDGNAVEPYKPNDITSAQSVYGQSKLAGELALIEHCQKYLILRTAWVFSEYGNNFVKTMVRLADEKVQLSVVADQYGCPTYAGDIAKAIVAICDQYRLQGMLNWGTYHYCGDHTTSWHGFARAIFSKAYQYQLINKIPKLTAISSEQYPTPAIRPSYSVLDTACLINLNVTASPWLASLGCVLKKLKQ